MGHFATAKFSLRAGIARRNCGRDLAWLGFPILQPFRFQRREGAGHVSFTIGGCSVRGTKVRGLNAPKSKVSTALGEWWRGKHLNHDHVLSLLGAISACGFKP